MKANDLLHLIYSIFLGFAVVAFVGIAVNTLYPEPRYTDTMSETVMADYRLMTSVVLLICATVVLVVSLVWPARQTVLVNGILLGGVFTMIYAIGMSVSSGTSFVRLAVAAAALVVTVVVGWFRFVGRRLAPSATPDALGAGSASPEFEARLDAVERKLRSLGSALSD